MTITAMLIAICLAAVTALLTEIVLSGRFNPAALNVRLLRWIPSMLPPVPMRVWSRGDTDKGMQLWQRPDGSGFFKIVRTYEPICKRCRARNRIRIIWQTDYVQDADPFSQIDQKQRFEYRCYRCGKQQDFLPLLGQSEWNSRR